MISNLNLRSNLAWLKLLSLSFTLTMLSGLLSGCSDLNHSLDTILSSDKDGVSHAEPRPATQQGYGNDDAETRTFSLNDFEHMDIKAAEALLRENGYLIKKRRNEFAKSSLLIATHNNGSAFRIPYDKASGKLQQVNVSLESVSKVSYQASPNLASATSNHYQLPEKTVNENAVLSTSVQNFNTRSNATTIDMKLITTGIGETRQTKSHEQLKLDCEKQAGSFDRDGLQNSYFCQLPAADAGKTCHSSNQCEGLCLADSRSCSAQQSNFGCLEILESGSPVTICID